MSVYMTETEQLEAIKTWWKRYNNVITIGLSVILLLVSGNKYWHWHQEKVNQQASTAYEQMMLASSNQDGQGVRAYANQLITDYGQTVYADVARLTLAKRYMLRENYPKAQKELEQVALHSTMPTLKDVANIRLARIFAAQKSYDQALTQLDHVNQLTYMPIVNELKGDIFAAKGQYQQAVVAYRKAMDDVQMHGMGNVFLEMKTNELVAMT